MMVGRRYVLLAAVLQIYIVNLFLFMFVPAVSLVIGQNGQQYQQVWPSRILLFVR